jgi:hypothetical protein
VCRASLPRRQGRWGRGRLCLLAWAVALAACAPDPSDRAPTQGTVTVVPGAAQQTITGWEATAYAGDDDPAFPRFKDAIVARAAGDLGINRIRLEVRSGVENREDYWTQYREGRLAPRLWRCLRYSTVDDDGNPATLREAGFQFAEVDHLVEHIVLPLRARLAARGERLFVNVTYVSFTGQMTEAGCPGGLGYGHHDPEEYAEFVLAVYRHLAHRHAIVPDAWGVILEPDNTATWRGREIGTAIAATARRLRAGGFTPRFIAPSTTSMANAVRYFDELASVPGALDHLAELAYHRYRDVSDASLTAIDQRARRHRIGAAMLEWIGAGHDELRADLTLARASAWAQYALATFDPRDDGSAYLVVDRRAAVPDQGVRMGRRTPFLRQYFRFVRAGAQRVDATSDTRALSPVAFRNRDGRHVVVVRAADAVEMRVIGLPPGVYGVTYTTEALGADDAPDVTVAIDHPLVTRIPARGVLTVHAR